MGDETGRQTRKAMRKSKRKEVVAIVRVNGAGSGAKRRNEQIRMPRRITALPLPQRTAMRGVGRRMVCIAFSASHRSRDIRILKLRMIEHERHCRIRSKLSGTD